MQEHYCLDISFCLSVISIQTPVYSIGYILSKNNLTLQKSIMNVSKLIHSVHYMVKLTKNISFLDRQLVNSITDISQEEFL